MSEETIQYAVELKLDAARKLGEILLVTPKNEGALLRGTQTEPPNTTPTLADIGISKKTSAQALGPVAAWRFK